MHSVSPVNGYSSFKTHASGSRICKRVYIYVGICTVLYVTPIDATASLKIYPCLFRLVRLSLPVYLSTSPQRLTHTHQILPHYLCQPCKYVLNKEAHTHIHTYIHAGSAGWCFPAFDVPHCITKFPQYLLFVREGVGSVTKNSIMCSQ